MKKAVYLFIVLMGIFFNKSNAQSGDEAVQLIILRHAEKEQSDNADPDLSATGKERAERLAAMLQDVIIDELYATDYKRTIQTLMPLAETKQLKVNSYNPGQLQELAGALSTKKGKTIVVAGHANTTPELVNLLQKENKYTSLAENDFGKVWILTLSKGKVLSCLLINTN